MKGTHANLTSIYLADKSTFTVFHYTIVWQLYISSILIEKLEKCAILVKSDKGGHTMDAKYPIGELRVPDHVTLDDVQEWLSEIAGYTGRLRETVDSLSDAQLNKTYRAGSWNVRQLVHHIADSQLTMYQRLKLALTDDNPAAPAFNQDKWAILPDTELRVEPSIRMLEGINERIVALGNSLTEEQLTRTFVHAVNGEVTVAKKVAKLAWHEAHHLSHIQMALERT